ncbi:Thymidylate kinase [Schistosoma japonicum]|uniref:dTMP kinase n=1 Tax=Schistosoma japonicum TaxID=6182 RepID=Q86DX8_SCHJA|nr:SJCHGC06009 protein [Schistosoma japonicum]KAH8861536.1 Thymidylate kinase [Schistosoma japonicum]KAH8861537.1 Thymidylate kinase [Schistosoma japonicum]KAH8861538.1 Thymidylate kinase [Schistosoma japonicum]KAH8861539.1 Thymidylate kinase [Schistosoma japonicum]
MAGSVSRGIFVVLEGADRVGKTTQASLLAKALSEITQKKTLSVKFPNRDTPLGHQLDAYLGGNGDINSHALHLLFTANRWEKQSEIRNAISNGISVVADRYIYSGIAYTAAKLPPTPNWEWCCEMEKGLLEADLVICLTPENLDELNSRNGYGNERYEKDDFQKRVLENYVRLSKEVELDNSEWQNNDETGDSVGLWHFIQATNKTVEEVHKCIMVLVKSKLESISGPEIHDCTKKKD